MGADLGARKGRNVASKVARRGENLVQYLKISLDIALDAKSFDAYWKI